MSRAASSPWATRSRALRSAIVSSITISWGGWTATRRRQTPTAFRWAGWRTMWRPPADWFSAAPRSLDAAAASTLPVAGLTAWMALVELGKLRAGQTVVVQGTGGVALFAVQFAAALGARVILTSSSDEKLERARALGATDTINRQQTPEWHQAVRDLTAGRGADHILEMAGGDNVQKSLEAVAVGGRISLVGLLDAPDFRLSIVPLLFRRASVIGIGVGHRRALEDMVRAVDWLGLTPVIDARDRFAELPKAMAPLRRGAFGQGGVHLRGARTAAASRNPPRPRP